MLAPEAYVCNIMCNYFVPWKEANKRKNDRVAEKAVTLRLAPTRATCTVQNCTHPIEASRSDKTEMERKNIWKVLHTNGFHEKGVIIEVVLHEQHPSHTLFTCVLHHHVEHPVFIQINEHHDPSIHNSARGSIPLTISCHPHHAPSTTHSRTPHAHSVKRRRCPWPLVIRSRSGKPSRFASPVRGRMGWASKNDMSRTWSSCCLRRLLIGMLT